MGRAELSRLKKTTLNTFYDVSRDWNLKQETNRSPGHFKYNQQESIISFYNGSEILLMDLDWIPSDPNYERLGSLEITGGFIDEASEVTQRAKEVVKTRIRYRLNQFNLIPKLLMTCNPSKTWLYQEFYKPDKQNALPANKAFIKALAIDNPHNPKAYLDSLRELKDKILRERLWFGNWEYEDDDTALFRFDDISDLFSNIVPEGKDRYLVVDAARWGRDLCVMMVYYGMVVKEIFVIERSDLNKVESEINRLREKHTIPLSHTLVDEDGLGGGVVDHLHCKGFVGNSSPIQPTERERDLGESKEEFKVNYQNLRSQCYYTLSDHVKDKKILVQTEDTFIKQRLSEDLEFIKAADVDKDNKLRVTPKDEIKEHLGRSPDFSDTLMMRMWFEVQPKIEPVLMFS